MLEDVDDVNVTDLANGEAIRHVHWSVWYLGLLPSASLEYGMDVELQHSPQARTESRDKL